ncbi:hypothetical protein GGR28_001098 [Lewinella aquimaris]|uniref:Lipoprotein n=1 Tax=Neolewinella aquimaris TaxID=1835722 RepID=A0A840E494_9BACT|nr:hypothetical protein [Neolewinella aquimaris]MBB4078485.1 hypothetical protein [Neolewinella aquimaris]
MKVIKRSIPVLATAILLFLSSCNRGFGCPTNLSLGELVSPLLSLLP